VRTLVDQHVGATHNHSERLWALVNLELWQRIYIDGEGADTPLVGVPAAAARVPAALAT
jgi:hypothetical protein